MSFEKETEVKSFLESRVEHAEEWDANNVLMPIFLIKELPQGSLELEVGEQVWPKEEIS